MYCSKCGTQNADQSSFCSKCGAPLDQAAEITASAGKDYTSKKKRSGVSPIPVFIAVLVLIVACSARYMMKNGINLLPGKGEADQNSSALVQQEPGSVSQNSNSETKAPASGQSYGQPGANYEEYILPTVDREYLSAEYFTEFGDDRLRLAINEVYARHGRRFSAQDLQAYFDGKSWYKGSIAPENFDEGVFNKYEKANIDLMNSLRERLKSGGFEPGWVYGYYTADFGDGKIIGIEFGWESGTDYDYMIRSGYQTEETYIRLQELEDDYWEGVDEDWSVFYNGVDQITVNDIVYQKESDMPHNAG